jgi:hypothetical protein
VANHHGDLPLGLGKPPQPEVRHRAASNCPHRVDACLEGPSGVQLSATQGSTGFVMVGKMFEEAGLIPDIKHLP